MSLFSNLQNTNNNANTNINNSNISSIFGNKDNSNTLLLGKNNFSFGNVENKSDINKNNNNNNNNTGNNSLFLNNNTDLNTNKDVNNIKKTDFKNTSLLSSSDNKLNNSNNIVAKVDNKDNLISTNSSNNLLDNSKVIENTKSSIYDINKEVNTFNLLGYPSILTNDTAKEEFFNKYSCNNYIIKPHENNINNNQFNKSLFKNNYVSEDINNINSNLDIECYLSKKKNIYNYYSTTPRVGQKLSINNYNFNLIEENINPNLIKSFSNLNYKNADNFNLNNNKSFYLDQNNFNNINNRIIDENSYENTLRNIMYYNKLYKNKHQLNLKEKNLLDTNNFDNYIYTSSLNKYQNNRSILESKANNLSYNKTLSLNKFNETSTSFNNLNLNLNDNNTELFNENIKSNDKKDKYKSLINHQDNYMNKSLSYTNIKNSNKNLDSIVFSYNKKNIDRLSKLCNNTLYNSLDFNKINKVKSKNVESSKELINKSIQSKKIIAVKFISKDPYFVIKKKISLDMKVNDIKNNLEHYFKEYLNDRFINICLLSCSKILNNDDNMFDVYKNYINNLREFGNTSYYLLDTNDDKLNLSNSLDIELIISNSSNSKKQKEQFYDKLNKIQLMNLPDNYDDNSTSPKSNCLNNNINDNNIGYNNYNNENLLSNTLNIEEKSTNKRKPLVLNKKYCLPNKEELPILTKDILTIPTIPELYSMTLNELENVENFTIFNKHGKITFPGKTNLRGINLDDIVDISEKSISVYSVNPNIVHKKNEGLNKNCFITINNLHCIDNLYVKTKEEYLNIVNNLGGYFIKYDNKLGTLEYYKDYFI